MFDIQNFECSVNQTLSIIKSVTRLITKKVSFYRGKIYYYFRQKNIAIMTKKFITDITIVKV